MGFGNARHDHGCKSTKEHECEHDDSLHLISPPFSLSLITYEGDNPRVGAGSIKLRQERTTHLMPADKRLSALPDHTTTALPCRSPSGPVGPPTPDPWRSDAARASADTQSA